MFRPPEMTELNYNQFSPYKRRWGESLFFLSYIEDAARCSLCFLVHWLVGRAPKLRTAGLSYYFYRELYKKMQ